MSNYPPTYPVGQEYQGQYRPVPPPPLPPRRPLSQYGHRPENPPANWQSGQGPATPGPPPPPLDQRPYTSYGGESPGQYTHQSPNAQYAAFSQPSQPAQAPPSNIMYGQTNTYGTTYGQSAPIQPSPYEQSSYSQAPPPLAQPYGYGMNQGQSSSPYGQSASPPLYQQSFNQNTSLAPSTYTSVNSPPPVPSHPQQPSSITTPSMNEPNLLETESYTPGPRPQTAQSPPAGPQSTYSLSTLSAPPSIQSQSSQNSGQSMYATTNVSTTKPSNNPFSQNADPHPKPYRRYSSEAQGNTTMTSPPSKYQSTLPPVSSSSIPVSQATSPPLVKTSSRPQVFNVSSPPPPSKSPVASTRPPPATSEPNLININPTSPPRQSAVPAKIPGTATRKQSAGAAQSVPLSTNITEPVFDQTRFLESSFERYKDVLRKEMVLSREGKHAEVITLLREFAESEITMRRARYSIPEEKVEPVPEPVIAPVSAPVPPQLTESVAPPRNDPPPDPERRPPEMEKRKPQSTFTADPFRRQSNERPPSVYVEKPDKPAPPATFSAILSQTSSYVVSPPETPVAEVPPVLTPPPPPKSPFRSEPPPNPPVQLTQGPPETAKPEPPPRRKLKNRTTPPIPESVALAQVLASIPKPLDVDPSLTPLRDRVTPLKDLNWLETEKSAFEEREHKIESKILEELGERQEAQSLRQTKLYAANQWELADQEAKDFEQETQRQKEEDLRESLRRWRSEYCDPSYERLHANFSTLTGVHKEITQLDGCENVDEQVKLLNETHEAFLGVMQQLDILTDELKTRQYRLKVSSARAADDWDMVNKFEREKEEEDNALKEQRGEFKLERLRLHGQCVKYLIENGVETLTDRKNKIKKELEKVLEALPAQATNEQLPSETSTDAYPSDELIAQFNESSIVLNSLYERINILYSLLQQKEYDLITDETAPAINKAFNSNDWNGGEKLRAEQAAQLKHLVDIGAQSRQARDEDSKAFSNRLSMYIDAHNGRQQTRLKAVTYGQGTDSGTAGSAMRPFMQEQTRSQMASNTSQMGGINNIGNSNTRYEYVYK